MVQIFMHTLQKTAAQLAEDYSFLSGKKPDAKPQPRAGARQPINAAARVIVGLAAGTCLAGLLVGISWDGGRGVFRDVPEVSVRPGINFDWMGPNAVTLAVSQATDDRELYRHRGQIADLLGLRPGDDVADVGSGSGFLAIELARRVGDNGRVFAVEINPALVEAIRAQAQAAGALNVRPHLGLETKLNINRREGGNFDLIVVADSYHHFEYPKSMLTSIRRLLRGRGELVVVEPHRLAGASPQETLDHVRLGREGLIREISEAGFALDSEPAAPFLKEFYILRFRKD